jgi:hypothetical protein
MKNFIHLFFFEITQVLIFKAKNSNLCKELNLQNQKFEWLEVYLHFVVYQYDYRFFTNIYIFNINFKVRYF